jgi:hypothetical protein
VKSCKSWILPLFLIILSEIPGAPAPMHWEGLPYPDGEKLFSVESYNYRMKGSLKLLLIWVGRDNVGGGTISRISSHSGVSAKRIDGYSVLFGSDPKAVPGNHNRWGYARELAWWNTDNSPEQLSKTLFEGFMSKSSEESMDELSRNEKKPGADELTLFEGSIGEVTPVQAYTHLWRFNAAGQATYLTPEGVSSSFLKARNHLAPDIERVLNNNPFQFDHPAGFFTAIRLLMDPVLDEFNSGLSISRFQNTTQRYVNSAHLYTLEITKLEIHEEYEVNNRSFQNVLQLDFRTLRHDMNRKHNFTLWIPTSGDYRGIPIKIADKPRWWLKVELTLDPEGTGN